MACAETIAVLANVPDSVCGLSGSLSKPVSLSRKGFFDMFPIYTTGGF